jgi:endo-1,4-beta-xylanase
MKKNWIVFMLAVWAPLIVTAQETKGLKDYFEPYFVMGVAVTPQHMNENTPEGKLILEHFKSVTPENVMKMGPIHPEENRYNWEPADKIVDFAVNHGLKVRGHTLCWHSQTPNWFFKNADGSEVSKEVLLKRLKDHIDAVAGRYRGKIYAWDVANEVISDVKDEFYRPSEFYKIIGEEFVEKAFEYAHAAAPDAKLFYNDYDEINPVKREKIYQMLKKLKEKGVPVHGVGLQGHWSIYEPTRTQLQETLDKFISLGLEVQVTELDVSVYPKEHSRREKTEADVASFNAQQEQLQIDQYRMIFEEFRKRKAVTSVTFWNVSDNRTWLDNFPVPRRKDYPLLFDTEFKPKKVYYEVTRDASKK